jgi:hypothetical protein
VVLERASSSEMSYYYDYRQSRGGCGGSYFFKRSAREVRLGMIVPTIIGDGPARAAREYFSASLPGRLVTLRENRDIFLTHPK